MELTFAQILQMALNDMASKETASIDHIVKNVPPHINRPIQIATHMRMRSAVGTLSRSLARVV